MTPASLTLLDTAVPYVTPARGAEVDVIIRGRIFLHFSKDLFPWIYHILTHVVVIKQSFKLSCDIPSLIRLCHYQIIHTINEAKHLAPTQPWAYIYRLPLTTAVSSQLA